MSKYFFILFWLLGATLTAVQTNAQIGGTCDLPAPDNLHITAISPTTASFAWDDVPLSDGFDFELRLASGPLVTNGHVDDTYYNAYGLIPNTRYVFRVWSVCMHTGIRGGMAEKGFETDFIVIGDQVPEYQNNSDKYIPSPNHWDDLFIEGDVEVFSAQQFRDEKIISENVFNIFKFAGQGNGQIGNDDEYRIEIHVANPVQWPELLPENNWLYTNHLDFAPFTPPGAPDSVFLNAESCNAYHRPSGEQYAKQKLQFTVSKNADGQTASLSWSCVTAGDYYQIYRYPVPVPGSDYGLQRLAQSASTVSVVGGDESETDQDAASSNSIGHSVNRDRSAFSQQTARPFPNPFTDRLVLSPNPQSTTAMIRLFDINGREVIQQEVSDPLQTTIIQTNHLPAGIYSLKYESDKQVTVFKVMKTN